MPILPTGHPVLTVQSSNYWSATTSADDPVIAWNERFDSGFVGSSGEKASTGLAWCVRGGMNADQY